MAQVHTQNEVADILKSSLLAFRSYNLRHPSFIVESLYLDFFNEFIRWIPISKDADSIKPVQQFFEMAFSDATMQICKIISQHPDGGLAIWQFIDDGKIMLRRDQHGYNKHLPGKSPKGIIPELWQDYNHWLIANYLWDGFVKSLEPSFSIVIPSDSDDPIKKLLAPEIKPLWGMWAAYNELGRPLLAMGVDSNSINVKPWVSVFKYRAYLNENGKFSRHSRLA